MLEGTEVPIASRLMFGTRGCHVSAEGLARRKNVTPQRDTTREQPVPIHHGAFHECIFRRL